MSINYSAAQLTEYFFYLDDLRRAGGVNLFGARPYLRRDFELNDADAAKVLSLWMDTYNPTKSLADRVRAVQP